MKLSYPSISSAFPALCLFFLASLSLNSCALRTGTKIPASSDENLSTFYRRTIQLEKTPVSSPKIYDGGTEIRQAMMELIHSAKKQILVGTFLLTDGPFSRQLLDALAEKSASGVEVRVIGDASSRFVMETQAFSYLKERGVSVAEFHPYWGKTLLRAFERDHRKYWIIDGRTVLLGGANLSDSSLMDSEKGGNLDFMVEFDSPLAAQHLRESFVRTWHESKIFGDEQVSPQTFPNSKIRDEKIGFWIFNQDDIKRQPPFGLAMVDGLCASARRSVWLVEPYTFTNEGILERIRTLSARGVDVHLILSARTRDPRFRYASLYGVRDLQKAGAKVWMYESETTPLHYKCALVDDRMAFIGSSNINYRSFHLSRELNVVFDDPASVGAVRKVIESLRPQCREISDQEAQTYRKLPFALWWLIMQAAG